MIIAMNRKGMCAEEELLIGPPGIGQNDSPDGWLYIK